MPGYFFVGVQVHFLRVLRAVAKGKMIYQPDRLDRENRHSIWVANLN